MTGEKEQIVEILTELEEFFGKKLNETQLQIWVARLAHWPARVIRDAVSWWYENEKWMPALSELVDVMRDQTQSKYPEEISTVDPMKSRLIALENRFYQDGEILEEEFEQLKKACIRSGRESFAEYVEAKKRRLIRTKTGEDFPVDIFQEFVLQESEA